MDSELPKTDQPGDMAAQPAASGDEALFRTFVDNMPALAWIADRDGAITWYNRRWYEYCGGTAEQMEGWGWQSVHDPNLLPSVMEKWRRSIATGERFEMTFPLKGADGAFRWFLTRVEPLRGGNGEIVRWFGTNTDVSPQIAAEDALRQAQAEAEASAAKHAAILGQLAEGVIVTDCAGRITMVNEAAHRLHGVAQLDVAPDDYSETYHLFTEEGDPYPPHELPLARAVRGEVVPDVRWRIRRPDGSEIVAAGGARPLLDREERQSGAVLTVRDETAREAAERQVRENEARLRALTDNLPGGIVYQVSTGMDGDQRRFLYVSRGHEKLTGVPAEEVLADPSIPYQMIVPNDRPRVVEAEAAAIRDKALFDVEVRSRHRNGEIRWFRLISEPREQPDGSLIWDGIQIDITRQKETEAALRENETRLRLAIEAGEIGEWELDLASDKSVRASRHDQIFGYDEPVADWGVERFIGHVLPEHRASVQAAFEAAAETDAGWHFECRIRRANDGEIRWIAVHSTRHVDEGGRARLFGLVQDITEEREVQEQLSQLNDTLEEQVAERTEERDRTWRLSRDMFAIFGLDGRLRRANPAWTEVLGLRPDEIEGKYHTELTHPDDADSGEEAIARLGQGATIADFEDRYRHKDGSYRWISWTAAAPEGDLIFAVGRDVTAEKERQAQLEAAQEALRQSQKMEAMGQLTGGVAHDFNNLLTPIVGSLDLLHRRGLGGERERRLMEGALASAERAKTLVQRLLAFARRQPLQASAVDIGALVEGMADLVASTSGPQVKISVEVADDLPAAVADPNQLEMALLNLAVNARDAMPDGGPLSIAARQEAIAPGHRTQLAPGRYACLSVADEGSGMTKDVLARAIEPFFSTKGVGRGTGLGLSMVHGLASQLGGALTISSRPGLGTRVDLWLPASEESAAAAEQPAAANVSPGEGVALLVDDEDLVRMSTADMLADLGFSVVETASAEEALRVINGGLAIDLLVTDHLMPGMTGTELACEVQARRPGLPVLLISGYADVEGVAADLPRLTKPFRRSDLAASIAGLTAETPDRASGAASLEDSDA